MRRHAPILTAALLSAALMLQHPAGFGAASVDQLPDLTGRASAIPTLKARDNFANQFEYDVTVRNRTSDPLVADSLVPVVERITELPAMGPAEWSVAALPMERSTGLPA